jgi:hypothetical protein
MLRSCGNVPPREDTLAAVRRIASSISVWCATDPNEPGAHEGIESVHFPPPKLSLRPGCLRGLLSIVQAVSVTMVLVGGPGRWSAMVRGNRGLSGWTPTRKGGGIAMAPAGRTSNRQPRARRPVAFCRMQFQLKTRSTASRTLRRSTAFPAIEPGSCVLASRIDATSAISMSRMGKDGPAETAWLKRVRPATAIGAQYASRLWGSVSSGLWNVAKSSLLNSVWQLACVGHAPVASGCFDAEAAGEYGGIEPNEDRSSRYGLSRDHPCRLYGKSRARGPRR